MKRIIEILLNIFDPGIPSELDNIPVVISDEEIEEDDDDDALEEEEEEEEVIPLSSETIKSYSTDFALPEMDQCIVRVTKVINNDKVQITTDKVNKYSIAIVPKRWLGCVHEKNYLLIQPPVDGSPNKTEIIRVIDGGYKRFYEANKVWPIKFDDPDLGFLGPKPPKVVKKKRKKKVKKKRPKKVEAAQTIEAPQTIEATGKKPPKDRKKPVGKNRICDAEEELESVSESDSDDSEKTRMDKRRRRLALIGTHYEKENVDNTTVTSAVVTSREPIVKDRDKMPMLYGNHQPWSAILQKKHMSEKQVKKHIQKEMKKMRKLIGKHAPTEDADLPCGAVKGQILTPWEAIAGKYTNKKQQLDYTE